MFFKLVFKLAKNWSIPHFFYFPDINECVDDTLFNCTDVQRCINDIGTYRCDCGENLFFIDGQCRGNDVMGTHMVNYLTNSIFIRLKINFRLKYFKKPSAWDWKKYFILRRSTTVTFSKVFVARDGCRKSSTEIEAMIFRTLVIVSMS